MRPQGALIFTQATLSRKIKNRDSLEQRVLSHPNALSSKRPRVVTRPDVEEALVEWITSMELKGEPYTWAMLQEKRRTMEEKLGVPEAERLTGSGWIASFRRTYCIKECHGEADSCGGDGRGTVASGFIGAPPAIDEPSAEKNVGETAVYDDDAIVSEIQRRQAIRSGEPAEDDDDDDDDDEDGDDRPQPSTTELMECCKKLEDAYIARLHADSSLDFLHNLRVFRGVLRREGKQKVKQTILDSFWNTK